MDTTDTRHELPQPQVDVAIRLVGMAWTALRRRCRQLLIAFTCVYLVLFWVPFIYGIATGDLPFNRYGFPLTADLGGYLTGSRIVLDGEMSKLYSLDHQVQAQQELFDDEYVTQTLNRYLAPPFVAFMYAPLAMIPFAYAALTWIGLSIILSAVAIRLLWPLVPNLHDFGYLKVLLVVFASFPGFDHVRSGQNTAISLLLMVIGLRLLLACRDRAAGAILGFGVFKPQLFVLFPLFFLLDRRWKALASWGAVAGVACIVSIAIVGIDGGRAYTALLTSDVYQDRLLDYRSWKMYTVGSLLRSIMPYGFVSGSAMTAMNLLVFAIGGVLVWLGHRRVRQRFTGAEAVTVSYSLTVLVTVTFAPHVFNYDTLLLVVPFLILLNTFPALTALRVALASAYLISVTTVTRSNAFFEMDWPMNVFAAPWAVVPVVACLAIVCRSLERDGAAQEQTVGEHPSTAEVAT